MHKVFKVHSVVDVITNSSTVIYTQATEATVKSFRNLINAILDIAGSTVRADDLFIFRLVPDMYTLREAMVDNSDEFGYDTEWYNSLSNDYSKKSKALEDKAIEIITENPSISWYTDLMKKGECNINLVVIAKDDKSEAAAKIMSALVDTIHAEESYDG